MLALELEVASHLAALRAGARGYLLMDVALEQLINEVRALVAGGTLLQPALTERLLPDLGITEWTTWSPSQGSELPKSSTQFSKIEDHSRLKVGAGPE